MNHLRFCVSRDILVTPSFLKVSFAAFRILGLQSFCFRTLNMISHCLLASLVCDGRSAFHFPQDPSCSHKSLLSFYFQDSLTVCDFQYFDYYMSECGSLEFILLEFVEILECVDCFSSNLGYLQPLFLQKFFQPLSFLSCSDSPYVCLYI